MLRKMEIIQFFLILCTFVVNEVFYCLFWWISLIEAVEEQKNENSFIRLFQVAAVLVLQYFFNGTSSVTTR